MALDDAAVDAAIDAYVAAMLPAPADPVAMKLGMRPLIKAIYDGIVANAEVVVTVPLDGTGTVT